MSRTTASLITCLLFLASARCDTTTVPDLAATEVNPVPGQQLPQLPPLDSDLDGVSDAADNCLNTWNPDQADADTDGSGDACDFCPKDNPDDSDRDGVCDSADACPGFDDFLDADWDGVPDACDNCPYNLNPSQGDSDADGQGDACEGPVVGKWIHSWPTDATAPSHADPENMIYFKVSRLPAGYYIDVLTWNLWLPCREVNMGSGLRYNHYGGPGACASYPIVNWEVEPCSTYPLWLQIRFPAEDRAEVTVWDPHGDCPYYFSGNRRITVRPL